MGITLSLKKLLIPQLDRRQFDCRLSDFCRKYITECEERYGVDEVERLLTRATR